MSQEVFWFSATNIILQDSDRIQSVPSRNCSNVKYHIFTSNSTGSITLGIQGVKRVDNDFTPPKILLTLQHCPLGFKYVNKSHGCGCKHISGHHLSCAINSTAGPTIYRHAPEWIGYDLATDQLLYHPVCPFDYCKPTSVNITTTKELFEQDKQCALHRTGLLCGQCKEGMSLMLGSYRCAHCSNVFLLLLLPFTVAGLLLVVLISVCNLTVTEGTINGLIFYANIIQLGSTTFFPTPSSYNPVIYGILTVFIAWLNLDLGIETCFYNGLDAYVKTWLQFAFPSTSG